MAEPGPPPGLHDAITSTLAPVQPLPAPWRRAARLLPPAGLLLVAVPLTWGIRLDAADVGPLRLWLGSALQAGLALVVFGGALAESIPGRLQSPRRLAGLATLGAGFVLALTALTFLASPTRVPALREAIYFRVCFNHTFGLGLVPLAAALWALRRGLAARPIVAGAMAGLGAGLLADAGWRLYCGASEPSHVLVAHAGGILALALAGALAGGLGLMRTEGP